MILKLGIEHLRLEVYEDCIIVNDDPGLTLTYFTARSHLIAYVFEWRKTVIVIK